MEKQVFAVVNDPRVARHQTDPEVRGLFGKVVTVDEETRESVYLNGKPAIDPKTREPIETVVVKGPTGITRRLSLATLKILV